MPKAPDSKPQKLTYKQELFVAAYLGEARGNATQAARIAGYARPEASGKENLRKPPIAARVNQKVEQAGATADEVLNKLKEIGLAPSFEFIEVLSRDKSGKPLKVKMDLGNQVKALELLGKYHQLFVDKQVVDVNVREHHRAVPQSTIDTIIQPAKRERRMEA